MNMRKFMKYFGAILCAAALSLTMQGGTRRAAWNRPFPPYHLLGNIYYVGAAGVSSFLIVTPKGSILLDGGLEETAPQIERNIAKLGFKIRDVKYLINSHAHYDHCGGLAALKRASGAQMIASAGDRKTLETGHQPNLGTTALPAFPPVKVDRVIGDGQTVALDGITMTAHLTPGHTKGCTTWTMPVSANGRTYHVVFDCSTSVAGNDLVHNTKYPGIVADYRHSFAVLRALPCDVFLGPHPEFFNMAEKVKELKQGNANAFVVPGELRAFVDQSEREFNEELAAQQKAAGK